jgi:heme/copper-type cytochrome/quinol oxidase subunit 3
LNFEAVLDIPLPRSGSALAENPPSKGDFKAYREKSAEKSFGQGPPPIFDEPAFGDDGDDANGETGEPTGNSLLAMMLFIGADVMFFAGLIGAFVVFRFGAESWPPPGQPRLPIGITALNTAILMLSAMTMIVVWRNLTLWNRTQVLKGLSITAVLGLTFLLVQGYEWVRLIGFGLRLSSGVFGGMFYVLIGCHGLHVLGAVIALVAVIARFWNPHHYGPKRTMGIKLVGMYWLLVVALWPVLYGLVYLS